jgi:hypothetical protein
VANPPDRQPFEVCPDPDATPGNFVVPLATLLLAMARREIAARQSRGVPISDASGP